MDDINQEKKAAKVLVIDDDGLFLEFLIEFLEDNGFHVLSAPNGIAGLQLAKVQMPDVMICDIKMPGLNGYDVLKRLRQDSVTQKIPFIFLTAEQMDSDRNCAIKLGADDYVTKPFRIKQLIQAIECQLK